jgi:hypothetical protein
MSAHLESAARALHAILSARDPDHVWSVEVRRNLRDIGGCPVATDAGDIDGRSDERPSGADDKPPGGTNARETGAGAHAGKSNEHS